MSQSIPQQFIIWSPAISQPYRLLNPVLLDSPQNPQKYGEISLWTPAKYGCNMTGWWLSHPSEKCDFVRQLEKYMEKCSKPPTRYFDWWSNHHLVFLARSNCQHLCWWNPCEYVLVTTIGIFFGPRSLLPVLFAAEIVGARRFLGGHLPRWIQDATQLGIIPT